jgi:4-amino-4-deoxy-L-arabinose transferase-like glycosyltransferase
MRRLKSNVWLRDRRNLLRLAWIFLLLVFLLGCIGYLHLRGIRLGGDSERYLQGAERLLQGQELDGKQRSYPGYILLVAIFDAVGLGLPGLIALQVLTAGAAAYLLYRLGMLLGSPGAGWLAAALYLLNYEILLWHTYVLTDSLFISFVIIAAYAIYSAGSRASIPRAVLALAAMVVCFSLRPNGWIILPAAILYWIFLASNLSSQRKAAFALSSILLFIPFIPGWRTSVEAEDPAKMFREGVVIWGYETANIDMPWEGSGETSLPDSPTLLLQHPLASLRLALARVWTELLHARPFYSSLRNIINILYLTLVYVFAAAAIIYKRREPFIWLIVLLVSSQMAIVALTFADWDGRFLLYVLPLIQLLAAWSIIRLIGSLFIRQHRFVENT